MTVHPYKEVFPLDFEIRGQRFAAAVLDDGLDTDPTFLLFRGDEEEAVVTAHLSPDSECGGFGHIIVRPVEG